MKNFPTIQTISAAVFAAFFLLLTAYLAMRPPSAANAGQGAITFLAAALCMFVANIPDIEKMKASLSSFEVTTREAKQIINEAQATVAELRQLATTLGAQQVESIASTGRLPRNQARRWDRQKADILETLKTLGLSEQQLATVEGADHEWVIIDYAYNVLKPLKPDDLDLQNPLHAKRHEDHVEAFHWGPPNPDECQMLLERHGVNDASTKDLLEDYRFYVATGKHRRPDVWAGRRPLMA